MERKDRMENLGNISEPPVFHFEREKIYKPHFHRLFSFNGKKELSPLKLNEAVRN